MITNLRVTYIIIFAYLSWRSRRVTGQSLFPEIPGQNVMGISGCVFFPTSGSRSRAGADSQSRKSDDRGSDKSSLRSTPDWKC